MLDDKIHESLDGAGANRPFDERKKARRQVSGSAQVSLSNQRVLQGKIYDLTTEGVSIYLDVQLRGNSPCALHLMVYHDGLVHSIELQATPTYALLVGGKGFRHGFQFLSPDQATHDRLSAICA